MKKLISLVLAALMCLSLCACNVPDDPVPYSAPESIPEEETGSPDAPDSVAAFPAEITDAAGRTVLFEKAPERIVSGYYIGTSILMALGRTGCLVGIEAKADTRPIYSLAAPELLELPSVGTAKSFDLETTVSLEPDLVVLPIKLSDAADALSEVGINVILINPESEDKLFDTIIMLGLATGSAKAPEITEFYAKAVNEINEKCGGAEPASVYLSGNSSYLKTAGSGMFQNDMIAAACCQNVAEGVNGAGWSEISYEQLLSWDPGCIVMASDAEYDAGDMISDTALSSLSALKDGRIYKIPGTVEAWDSPVPAGFLGSCYTASKIYSDSYTFEDYSSVAKEFYEKFYGITLADDMLK